MEHSIVEEPGGIPKFSKYQAFVAAVLALLQFTIVLDFVIISPLGDILMKQMQISTAQFGWIVSSYAFSAGASGIITAGFADKFDRKKLLLLFYTGFTVGTLLCGLADSYVMLLVARIITGLFGGVIGSISLAIVTDLFPISQRGRVIGFIQMAFAGSQILGIPIGILVANHWGWHATFFMIVALCILILAAVFMRMQAVDQHLKIRSERSPLLHLWHTVINPRYQVGFLATAFLAIGGFMLMPFSSAFMVNNVGISHEQLPLVFMLTGVSSVVVMPLVGRLSDRFDKFRIFAIGSVLAIVMVMVYTHMSRSPLWFMILVNVILFMGIMSRSIPATALNTSVPLAQDRGAYMSITSSLQQMSGGIAAMIAGLIVQQRTPDAPLVHFDTLGYVVSVVILVCIYLIYRVYRMLKPVVAG